MRSFIQVVLKGVAFIVSGCIIVVGALAGIVILLGTYGGGIWLCSIGLDWAGPAAAQDPMVGYPIILLLLLALGAWVPAVGPIVTFWGALGTFALASALAESVGQMVTGDGE